ncbi:MAG: ABC transporter substrate-binding protein, partial [Chloroflexi bacterium]|nr:ABC transporter substrate-binding protein [Chloroflexota bacterium]
AAEDLPSFDLHTETSAAHNIHNQKMYSTLVWNPDGDVLVPDAAESYSVSGDGLVWTFKLRPDVKFQTVKAPYKASPRDGTLMTAKDVKWSLEKIMGLHGEIISARSGWMKEFVDVDRPDNGIEIVDNLTLKVHMASPLSSFANLLSIGYSGIVPDGIRRADMANRPYGSGPFKVKDIQHGAVWSYERNPDYWKPRLPYLDGWEFIIMSGTAITQAAWLTKKIDITGGFPSTDNEATYKQKFDAGEAYQKVYSSDCRPQGVVMNSTRPPFNDKKLREAVNLVIDRSGYIASVHNGHAENALFLPTGGWGHSLQEVNQYPGYRQPHQADVDAAKKIVQELYPSGLSLKMMARNTTGYMTQNEYIASDLRKIMDVTLDAQGTAVIFDRAAKLDYTLWAYWFCQTTNTLEEFFSYFITGGSRNWFGYSVPEFDKAYREVAAISEPVAKKKKALEMEQMIYNFLPMAPLPVHTTTRTAWSYVKDLPLGVTQYSREKNELIWRSDV